MNPRLSNLPVRFCLIAMIRPGCHNRCMYQIGEKPPRADETLIQSAMLRAGAQVHTIVGLIAMCRSAVQDSPDTALMLETELRRFVAGAGLSHDH